MMKIESQDKNVDELLKGNTFVIPRFQRSYSWEAEHIFQFWSDIIANFASSYFIGSMVVYKLGRSQLGIVDGQQRLTTITILLCAIRDAFRGIGDEAQALGLQSYIEQRDRENKTMYVLETETSYPFLQEVVLKDGPADVPLDIGREEEAISRAFEIFTAKIKDKLVDLSTSEDDEENKATATKWLAKLRDTVFDLKLIVVTLDREEDAYLIFETLNTRGKDLALSDLLRNLFTKYLKPRGSVDQAKLKWARVHEIISSAPTPLDPDTFIVHSWQSRFDFVTKAKVFAKAKEQVNQANANKHLASFIEDAGYWRSIFDTDYAWTRAEKEVARSLSALRIFKVVQPTPGILSLIRAFREKKIKYRVLRDSLSLIEKFHFSFNAVTSSRSSGGISGMYSSFGRQVYGAKDAAEVVAAILELQTKIRERAAYPSEFDAAFEQIIYTKAQSSQKALVQYILRRVATYEEQPFIGESDDLTIEHLLPQSDQNFNENTLGQIGNLILVDGKTNGLLSNKSFSEKKAILEKKGYKLPDALAGVNELTPDVIGENTKRISEIAREKVWKV